MKKMFFITLLMLICTIGMNAQRAVTVESIEGAETVNFGTMNYPSVIQALCTETGGTADGTLRLQASVDGTSWQYITESDNVANFFPNDTLTITDGAVYVISLKNKTFPYWRVSGAGTSGDTTQVTIKYFKH